VPLSLERRNIDAIQLLAKPRADGRKKPHHEIATKKRFLPPGYGVETDLLPVHK
jgi:hypothetical protein